MAILGPTTVTGSLNVSNELKEQGDRVYSPNNTNIGTGATNYAAGNHTHSYLPLSGGTITGITYFSAALQMNAAGSGSTEDSYPIRFQARAADSAYTQDLKMDSLGDLYIGSNVILTESSYQDTTLTKTGGSITFNDNVELHFGTGKDIDFYFNGGEFYMDINNGEDWSIRDGNSSNATKFRFDVDNGIFQTTRVTHTSDTDTYIHWNDNNTVSFYAGGSNVGGFSSEGLTPASSTLHGGVKARVSGTTLYLRNDTSDA